MDASHPIFQIHDTKVSRVAQLYGLGLLERDEARDLLGLKSEGPEADDAQ